jgi:hypothetical protein
MKKSFAVLLLTVFLAGGIFAQEKKNFVGGTVGLLEFGAHYERMLTPKFSVGAEAYWNSFILFWNTAAIKAFGRMYPLVDNEMPVFNNLFVDIGLGFGWYTGDQDFEYEYQGTTYKFKDTLVAINGFLIEPGFGWKIDFNKPGGFYLEPAFSLPIVIGKKNFAVVWSNDDVKGDFGIGVNGRLRLGMGYAF